MTRSLAAEELDKCRVRVNDSEAKPSREVKAGDTVARMLLVLSISSQSGLAPVAQQLTGSVDEGRFSKATI